MQCPVDSTTLQMTERQGIEIDYCPTCRGVWLDRGELDKIIERSAATMVGGPEPAAPVQRDSGSRSRHEDRYDRDRDHDRGEHGRHPKRRKRGGFLEDLFDFG
jgi:Zn-finger nucleic acid-binding protein